MSLFKSQAERNRELINNLTKKVQRLEQEKQRMAGDLFAGGVTLNEQLNERNQPLALTSPEASGTAIPVMPQISGAGVLQPLSPEQTARVYNAQQYRDMLNAGRRFTEDQFAVGEKFRKNEMMRQLEGAKRRQRIATQPAARLTASPATVAGRRAPFRAAAASLHDTSL